MNTAQPSSQILGSWKEIASYLGKSVRTVQRWEESHRLPVRRPLGASQGVVYASRQDLDRWRISDWMPQPDKGQCDLVRVDTAITSGLVAESSMLRHAAHELSQDLALQLMRTQLECEALMQTTAQGRPNKSAARGGRIALDS